MDIGHFFLPSAEVVEVWTIIHDNGKCSTSIFSPPAVPICWSGCTVQMDQSYEGQLLQKIIWCTKFIIIIIIIEHWRFNIVEFNVCYCVDKLWFC